MTAGHKWKRLQRAHGMTPPTEALIKAWMDDFQIDRAEALSRMHAERARHEYWINDLYQVEVTRDVENRSAHINIRRRDGYPGRDWRHFQQIKNEIVGPECEAIELYPAESRLMDEANKYHLWASTDPAFRFPFGMEKRTVRFGDDTQSGLRQRPEMQFAKER